MRPCAHAEDVRTEYVRTRYVHMCSAEDVQGEIVCTGYVHMCMQRMCVRNMRMLGMCICELVPRWELVDRCTSVEWIEINRH